MSTPKYTSGASVAIGQAAAFQLPPRVFRGRLTGMLFDTDRSFLLPSAIPAIQEVKLFYDDHPGLTVLVSGHADRAGDATYNLDLSVERARSIEAFLQDKVDDWMAWYQSGKPASKRWGTREDQHMLSALRDDGGAPFYAGAIHGRVDPGTKAAIERFQEANGLPKKSPADEATRRKLVEKYMATDDTTLPAGTPIEHHGCGETHPAQATADGVAADENRRVEVFFFEGAVDPPAQARCPSGGCPEYPKWVEQTVETIDVNIRPEFSFLVVDELGLPLAKRKVKLVYAGRTRQAETDAEGVIRARMLPDEEIEIEIADVQEVRIGDGTTTPSGKHFGVGGTTPGQAST
jgi:outer membrane protein OmpA-like peptidoglycan-associated protein